MTHSLFREVPVLKQIEQKNRHFRRIEVVWRSPPHPPPHHHYRQHTCKTEAGAVHISQCVSLTTYLKILIGPLSHHPSLHLHLLKLPLECIHTCESDICSELVAGMLLTLWIASDPRDPCNFSEPLRGFPAPLPMSLNPIWTWGQVTPRPTSKSRLDVI